MDSWDDLLGFIKGGKVVPVIGPDLLTVQIDGQEILLYHYLARRLAIELKVEDGGDLPPDMTINHVVCKYLQAGGSQAKIYLRINSILQSTPLGIPNSLRKLARIKPFQLFVSTTFDSLMQQALDAERFAGAPRTVGYSYAPNKELDKADLPRDYKNLRPPVVFRLFGKASEEPDFVVTEEDTLEFVSALQLEERRPHQLFDELKSNHLLFIGNSLPDWLARFFVRLTRGERLSSGTNNKMQYFADDQTRHDKNLILFLRSFGRAQLEIFTESGPLEFVNQLSEKWEARYPYEPPAPFIEPTGPADREIKLESDRPVGQKSKIETILPRNEEVAMESMERDAIFISYAREDEVAARRIADTLEEAGISVWLDRDRIQHGHDWSQKIQANISRCSLFFPLTSHQTHERREGVFLAEWRWAEERTHRLQPGEIFIIPIPIDDSPVPDRFGSKHYEVFPDGKLPSEFVRWIKKVTLKIQNRERVS